MQLSQQRPRNWARYEYGYLTSDQFFSQCR